MTSHWKQCNISLQHAANAVNARRFCLPLDSCDHEVQTALDLSAVYETVNVRGIDILSSGASCAFAGWEEDEDEYRKLGKDGNSL